MRNFINHLLFIALLLGSGLSGDVFAADAKAGDSTYKDTVGAIAQASRETPAADEDIHYDYETPFYGVEVRRQGTVQFSKDYDEVAAISPDGYLLIKERRWFTTRMLEVTPGEAGKPLHRFSMRGRSLEFDERAKEWLREVMPELVVKTGLDAERRVAELLSRGGTDAVLREISRVEYNRAKRIYFLELLEQGNLNDEELLRVIRRASKEISSSSQLTQLLSELAEKYPPDPRFTAEFFRGAEEISSSSQKRAAIQNIAASRKLNVEAAVAMGRSIQTISSSSEKARALESMAKVCPAEDAAIFAYLKAAESINSSSESANALIALCERTDLSNRGWAGIAETAATISSSSRKSSVLQQVAENCPPDDEVMIACLRAAGSIGSSSEKANAIAAVIGRENLSEAVYIEIARAAAAISSSSEKGRVLRKMAAVCPTGDAVARAYLDCVFGISSSSEKEEALVALLQREGLSQSILGEILRRANSEISSSSSRQAIVDMVSQRMNVN